MISSLVGQATGLFYELFSYNRGNFQYDRRQRQIMEYELAGMRIEQVALWREDVRQVCGLTPRKVENYLLVIALELGMCVMALCKGRVPPGAPAWLTTCHTISVCAAMMYLFLALWFGMHAFVSAQAYKVRILTQLVRLPIPTWQSLEASRTYSSAFEKLNPKQMVRVPFAMGTQEQQNVTNGGPAAPNGNQAASEYPAPYGRSQAVDQPPASDPWGLERRGDTITELAPSVNVRTDHQKHIWLVREAQKFYQTYDAFCRVSMSAGTCCLSVFFCYYCMTYVLTENGAPVMAWAGMIIFIACAMVLLRSDLMLVGRQYFIACCLLFASPVISAVVTFHSSLYSGDPGKWEYAMPVSLAIHGLWHIYFLWILRVREVQTGAVLPMAARSIIYIDPFGWAKHTSTWWRRLSAQFQLAGRAPPSSAAAERGQGTNASMGSLRGSNASVGSVGSSINSNDELQHTVQPSPTAQCVNTLGPMRPEDVDGMAQSSRIERLSTASGLGRLNTPAGVLPSAPQRRLTTPSRSERDESISFRPQSFAAYDDLEEKTAAKEVETGTDIHGEKPGSLPWNIFFASTIFLSMMWFVATGLCIHNTLYSFDVFQEGKYGELDEAMRKVQPVPLLSGVRFRTTWNHTLARAHGLACDPDGQTFASWGRQADGRTNFLMGKLNLAASRGPTVHFSPAPLCSEMVTPGDSVQDLSLHGCSDEAGCRALILPKRGHSLVSCPLSGRASHDENSSLPVIPGLQGSLLLSRAWLEDSGGAPLDGSSSKSEGFLHPEEISSISTAPCPGDDRNAWRNKASCVVVGTTSRRVVQLSVGESSSSEQMWVPRRLLQDDHGEVPGPGSLALLGRRYLGVLDRKTSLIRVIDLQRGGTSAGIWKLPSISHHHGGSSRPGEWASICAGGDSFYALEDREGPALWRFPLPWSLL